MLPRFRIDGTNDWKVDHTKTSNVKFCLTDQEKNFDSDFFNKDRTYYTLSFIYRVDELNETIYFAYDRPYTFSQDYR